MNRMMLVIALMLPVTFGGCDRRVQVQVPDAKITLNDRVLDLAQVRAIENPEILVKLIAAIPPDKQAEVIRELINSRERLAQSALQRESERGAHWIDVLKILANWAAAIGVGTLIP